MRNLFNLQLLLLCTFCVSLLLSIGCSKEGNHPSSEGVVDIEGNQYETIKIGDQVWMKENLKVTKYRNGDPITHRNYSEWRAASNDDTEGVYCYKEDKPDNKEIYGALYNWHAAVDSRGLAPEGWRIPSNSDWQTLVDFIGGAETGGGKLKEKGFEHWNVPNTGATNELGFTALPGGIRTEAIEPEGIYGRSAYFWSSDESSTNDNWGLARFMRDNEEWICCDDPGNSIASKYYGFSIRCIKN